jgi:hypothetical protein
MLFALHHSLNRVQSLSCADYAAFVASGGVRSF